MPANDTTDKIQELQRALYRAAKESRTRRFHALYDKIHRMDILRQAWEQVRSKRGSAGIDDQTLAEIGEIGVEAFLAEIQGSLRQRTYRPAPARRVYIEKSDGRQRPLGIPTVRDRVAQTATKIVVEPIFEADFRECSYGFRPQRSAHQAIERIRQAANAGHNWVLDLDIKGFFDHLNHEKLMILLEQRISDRQTLKLVKKWLKAGYMEEGRVYATAEGTPQGGVISPLLANIYLNYLDTLWEKQCGHLGTLVRYADDMVVLCRTRRAAEQAQRALTQILDRLNLEMHPTKTRQVNLWQGEDGFDFLGFHHRKVESWRWRGRLYLQHWPSQKAMERIRQRIRDLTDRRKPSAILVIEALNATLRGWSAYFGVGNVNRHFQALDRFVHERFTIWWNQRRGLQQRHLPRRGMYAFLRAMAIFRLTGRVRWSRTNTPASACAR